MRTLITTALVLFACGSVTGCSDRSSRPSGAGGPPIPAGADPIVLRASRAGGLVSAYAYPALDSVLWRSGSRVPALDRVIAFGAEDGYLAAMDTSGLPVRLDLRLGTVARNGKLPVRTASSADGADIYAITSTGEVTRYTPNGSDWNFTPDVAASALFAQNDGSVILVGMDGPRVRLWRVRPPGQGISDSVTFAANGDAPGVQATVARTAGMVGDRLYFGANEALMAIGARTMDAVLDVAMGDPVQAVTSTPSGDRLFVALVGDRSLRIVDRFEESVTGKVRLPGPVRELRMDPLGRVLLARGGGDTVYVVSVATDQIAGTVMTTWRGDLPTVMPDGAVALVRGADVVFAASGTYADGRRITGGADDFWYVMRWNGFRPRAAGLDQPVEFRRGLRRYQDVDSADAATQELRADSATDTLTRSGRDGILDSAGKARVPSGPVPPAPPAAGAARAPARRSRRDSAFIVSFATLLDQAGANNLSNRIRVDGQRARVVTSTTSGTPVYRVILGPYRTRGEAERVGRTSGQSYWVFEGTP